MPHRQNDNDNCKRYLVRATGGSAPPCSFLASLPDEPAIGLVHTIGPARQPHTVVIRTDAPAAQALAQRFSHTNQLMIEPDRPSSMFGQGPA
jgi:hypothetical protein